MKVLNAQFHGLTFTIYGSKMTEYGNVLHYQKAEIPMSPLDHLPQAAQYLLTVLSLQVMLFFFCDKHLSKAVFIN